MPTPRLFLPLLLLAPLALAAQAPDPARTTTGLALDVGGGTLRVDVCTADVLRVTFAKGAGFAARPSMIAAPKRCDARPDFTVTRAAGTVTVATATVQARVDTTSGAVTFLDRSGAIVLAEKPGGRRLAPAIVQGERTHYVRQEWLPNDGELIYGLGAHQLGLLDIKDYDLDLWQHNVVDIVPVFVSSRGYGILWDNTSFTRWGDLGDPEPMPPARLFDASGAPGGLTGTYFADASFGKQVAVRVDPQIDIAFGDAESAAANRRLHPALPEKGDISIRWEGAIEPAASGDHTFHAFSNTGIKVWIDDRLVVDHWRQSWLPMQDVARVRLEAGRKHRIKVEWSRDQGGIGAMQLRWKAPVAGRTTSLWSEVGDGIDYYFLYGPELDGVVRGYRRVSGEAPMMPVWAYGLWQSRERYQTQQESLDVLKRFRESRIPIDVIVQDWFYWKAGDWGSHQFDRERFPDPDGWIKAIHDTYKARLMISVWGKFYPGTANFDAMQAKGFLFQPNLKLGLKDWLGFPYTFYDPYSAESRALFWTQIEQALFRKGVDAWWMDATEPDIMPVPSLEGQRAHAHPTRAGTGARVLNAYSLANSQGIYEGQRLAAPDQRVFLLTRSGFAGQQRYASATWSGDISSTWTAFRRQIPAGLSFSLSGVPYWTVDIGGFSVPPRWMRTPQAPADAEEWAELNTRWFQYGTFLPLTRVHGQAPAREMFVYGESSDAYKTQLTFARLRYRLLPYVYAVAGQVTHEAGTMLRPLVMDFRADAAARGIGDQYMFGPAFLVSPVTAYRARTREVYLPQGARWYDFWTGVASDGGQRVEAAAPYDRLPVHVRAGAIVPMGPELQYTTEKPADPVTLYVYTGADGRFTLYEDQGLTYAYERGAATRIPIRWTEATRTLSIGARQGSFPGMLRQRRFEIVVVSPAKAVGFSFTPAPDRTVTYNGTAVSVTLR